jgi:hypothetical protein
MLFASSIIAVMCRASPDLHKQAAQLASNMTSTLHLETTLITFAPVDNPSDTMICSSCEILTIDRLYTRAGEPVNTRDRTTWNRNGYLELHSSYQSLRRAARNGCTNCLSFHEKFITLDGGFKCLTKRLAVLAGSQDSPVPIIAYLDFGTKISIKGKSLIANLNLQVGTEIANPGVNPLILTFKIIRPRGCCSRLGNCSIHNI